MPAAMKRVASFFIARNVGTRCFLSITESASIATFSSQAMRQGAPSILRTIPCALAPVCASGDNYYRTNAGSLFPYAALGLVTGATLTAQAHCEAPASPRGYDEAMLERRSQNVRRYVDELVLKTDTASYIPQGKQPAPEEGRDSS
eukprot:894275-Prorocentrum_minimum.AAC.4